MASKRPTGTMTDRFMIAPSAIRSNTTCRPYSLLRRPAEHPRELVRHQNRHQNAGDGQPRLHDLAQHVALNGPFHGDELRALALI